MFSMHHAPYFTLHVRRSTLTRPQSCLIPATFAYSHQYTLVGWMLLAHTQKAGGMMSTSGYLLRSEASADDDEQCLTIKVVLHSFANTAQSLQAIFTRLRPQNILSTIDSSSPASRTLVTTSGTHGYLLRCEVCHGTVMEEGRQLLYRLALCAFRSMTFCAA
jgi:hypothetical protein